MGATTVSYTYNKDGYILTQQTVIPASCTNLVTFVYDEKNNIIQKETRIFKNNEWIISDSLKQKFDAKGNVIEKYTYDQIPKFNEEGYLIFRDTIKTTYNDLGLITSEYSHSNNPETGKWKLPSTSYFSYDKYNRLVKYQETGQLIPNGAIVLLSEKNWYYKVKTESLKVTNNKLLAITFDTELAQNDVLVQNIKVDAIIKNGDDFYVVNAWVNDSDSSSLIIEFNRPMVGGEKFAINLNQGLNTENGRNVTFDVEMGNTATGVASFSDSNINIYPTIACDKITITSDAKIASIQILTLSGIEIASFDAQNLQSLEINIDNLPSGNYIVMVKSEESIVSSKIIKQ
ncbi:MAG: T9SS type A sorting domain-containing protein [Bacteroidales bacterium]|nr:T9SS type A sorting domain-containing protein [Bacteroidales bacterium]